MMRAKVITLRKSEREYAIEQIIHQLKQVTDLQITTMVIYGCNNGRREMLIIKTKC